MRANCEFYLRFARARPARLVGALDLDNSAGPSTIIAPPRNVTALPRITRIAEIPRNEATATPFDQARLSITHIPCENLPFLLLTDIDVATPVTRAAQWLPQRRRTGRSRPEKCRRWSSPECR